MKSSKVGIIQVQKASRLDVGDLPNGESTCVLDYICNADEGDFDDPVYFMVFVKTGARSTDDGWVCDYDSKVKVVMLEEGAQYLQRLTRLGRLRHKPKCSPESYPEARSTLPKT